MVEERGLSVDQAGYDECRARAQLVSQAGTAQATDYITLDVHDISELKKRGVPATDDSPKYCYTSDEAGMYNFKGCTGRVLAIRMRQGFVESLPTGSHECALVLDRSAFYAEQGGQIYDLGYMCKPAEAAGDDDMEFSLKNCQVHGGYVLHSGNLNGAVAIGNVLEQHIDDERRRRVMNNHTGTHVLNFALRHVLGAADQRGSLVAPERLRFDFTANKSLTTEQIQQVEEKANEVVGKNLIVYAANTPLKNAKEVQGLRAIFDEVYPDPVRVVSIGTPVDQLVSDPSSDAAFLSSVELCGGTHLHRSGHMNRLIVVSEDALAKGIRRVVAVTGQDAQFSELQAERLRSKVDEMGQKTSAVQSTDRQTERQLSRQIVQLSEEISSSPISAWLKDILRSSLKQFKERLDKLDKQRKADLVRLVTERCEAMLAAKTDQPQPATIIDQLDGAAENPKALDAAVKLCRSKLPETAVLLVGSDTTNDRVLCMSYVPASRQQHGLNANEWVGAVAGLFGGRAGGKPTAAQATGNGVGKIAEVLTLAQQFAKAKLS